MTKLHFLLRASVFRDLELYNKPTNTFVGGFIDSPQMNFIEAGRLGDKEAKSVGIRPEHITLSRDSGDWKGKVIPVAHLCADTILYLETEVIGLLTVRLFSEHRYDIDETDYAKPNKTATHRFGANDSALNA